MITILAVLLFILQGLLAFCVGYLLILTVAAWRAPRIGPAALSNPNKRFIILIPAHNEERLLPSCLENLQQLDYPAEYYAVHVVADNCTDRTSVLAEEGGAKVHVRNDLHLRGKGYAIQWLYGKVLQSGEAHDAVVILDADTVVSPNFLQAMAARLERGERAIQAYYTVRAPFGSWTGGLRYAALAVLHYLRPQGRMVFGGSAGLKGNGMVFSAALLSRHTWSASVTEDIEFHMALLLAGERVTFAPETIVWGEMPDTLIHSRSQQVRWEQGRLEMARKYVPVLVTAAWNAARLGQFRRVYILLDAVMEHLIPPFSVLLGLSAVIWAFDLGFLLAVQSALFTPGSEGAALVKDLARAIFFIGTGQLVGQAVYLFTGLMLARAPKEIYRSLVYAPVFVVWKIVQYVGILLGQKRQGWVRTTRNER